jgi:hypothetical protein
VSDSPVARLIFFRSWMIFTRAHGRCLLPEAQASKGIALLFGAPSVWDGTPLLYVRADTASKNTAEHSRLRAYRAVYL